MHTSQKEKAQFCFSIMKMYCIQGVMIQFNYLFKNNKKNKIKSPFYQQLINLQNVEQSMAKPFLCSCFSLFLFEMPLFATLTISLRNLKRFLKSFNQYISGLLLFLLAHIAETVCKVMSLD